LVMKGAGGRNNAVFREIALGRFNQAVLSALNVDEAMILNPLAVAITLRDRETVKAMVECMASGVSAWEQENKTVMMWAAVSDDLEMLDILAHYGADVNRQGQRGYFALDEAMECGLRRARGVSNKGSFLSSRFWEAANCGNREKVRQYMAVFRERALNNTGMIRAIARMGGRSRMLEGVEAKLSGANLVFRESCREDMAVKYFIDVLLAR
ncbi:MAG TPA: ankyrin repeat domain-containing protein, partial [Candidatus Goldiibacteriota bacterium]|nr:ankyrin repeat domain-containing protein [Candidatus Goldiibacteriota bacterium]